MFDSIKGALSKQEERNSYADILSMKAGNTYTVRLLPNVEAPEKSFFHYYTVGWESFATGQYVQSISPQSFGERDPILEARYRIYKHGTDDEKEKIKSVRRAEKWLVNAYIVDDTENPDNNGEVKIIRYGKQLDKIIRRAIDGEDSDEFGPRIFDLGTNGVNLKIEVESQGEYPTYVSSRFTGSKSDLGLSDSRIEEIYKSTHKLEEVFQIKSYEELEKMFQEHYLVNELSSDSYSAPAVNESNSYPAVESVTVTNSSPAATDTAIDDDDSIVAELLAGIDD
jgi:hypothetical protein